MKMGRVLPGALLLTFPALTLLTFLVTRGPDSTQAISTVIPLIQPKQTANQDWRATDATSEAAHTPNDPNAQESTAHSFRLTRNDDKVTVLKDALHRLPDQWIPEMSLLEESDWLRAAEKPLQTVTDFRKVLASLRGAAERRFGGELQPGLTRYFFEKNGSFPHDLRSLVPYLDGRITPAMLQRYEVVAPKESDKINVGSDWVITQRELVDSEFDSRLYVGLHGFGAVGRSLSP